MKLGWHGRLALTQRLWQSSRCRHLCITSSNRESGTIAKRPERPAHQELPASPARTRFAPSPTGYLHLGSLRTALYNFLLAKATGGQFILRIEDTDQKRTVPDAEERLYQDLRWAGLPWDEGPDIGGPKGVYRQSERTLLYRDRAEELLQNGHAYRCFGSEDPTQHAMRCRERKCQDIPVAESIERATQAESHVIRLKMPENDPIFVDLVYGKVKRPPPKATAGQERQICYQDPVMIKSDGYPTYHLANVIDDHYMEITHVLRGVEWLPSGVIHMALYKAFGWKPPAFAHLGLLQNKEGQKFSKRDGDAKSTIRSLARSGIFPEALVNFAALHGWSHNLGDDFLRKSDLIQNFDMKFTKGDSLVVGEKLYFLQKRYAELYAREGGEMCRSMIESVCNSIKEMAQLEETSLDLSDAALAEKVTQLVQEEADHYTTPKAFSEKYAFLFFPRLHKNTRPKLKLQIVQNNLDVLRGHFAAIPAGKWNSDDLKEVVESLAHQLYGNAETDIAEANGKDESKERAAKTIRADLHRFLRWAISRDYDGPPTTKTLVILGKGQCLERLDEAVVLMRSQI